MNTPWPQFVLFAAKSSIYLATAIITATLWTLMMTISALVSQEYVFRWSAFWFTAIISGVVTLVLLLDMIAAPIFIRQGQGDLVTNPLVNVPLLTFIPSAAVPLTLALWPLAVFFILMCRFAHMPCVKAV
ncbi:hypothetical protein BDV96DRAFT_607194 [Lophiotrema nucula]|uniref:Uncharacterized protein n=1 Tax=Lophiotrema nucula TaxID=690887 RepID=A0A6A5YHK0_9PLEO|nr:hypothetical protein BDV96DRAFT_607194 [Lophiotrema nucula]